MEQYTVTGMSCAACSARVEKAVSAVPGVTSCAVSLLTNSMGVEGTADPAAVIRAVEEAGYGAAKKGETGRKTDENTLADTETPRLVRRLAASVALLLPLLYVSMGHMMWNWPLPPFFDGNHVAMGILQLLFAAVILLINRKFFISGWKGLRHRAPNMDTLVAMGSGISFLWSVGVLFHMTRAVADGDAAAVQADMAGFYFESAAMILTLITVGKTLEAYSKGRTTSALKALMDLSPKTAVILKDGAEVTVPVTDVRVGDVFVVRPGASVPVDGTVIEGESAVDEAALTGESVPVDKTAGDAVAAGTVNQSGFLRCTATRVGEDTTLAKIIGMVSDAAATKAPIAKIADRVSGVFVPTVIGISLLTLIAWLLIGRGAGYALSRAIAVLVISCPCALGLATPVAIMVGSGVGARSGILFKTAVSLEAMGRVDIVVLDKTGTVTEGAPRVTDVVPTGDEAELLNTALALEAKSEHPLARAILQYAAERGEKAPETTDFAAVAGKGLTARQDGTPLYGGNLAFIETVATVSADLRASAAALANEGKTPLFFAKNDTVLGLIAVADVIKPTSADAVKQLKGMGLRVVMLTGDNARTAAAIGRAAGVDEVIAGVLPDGKEAAIRRLQQSGKVAMVGDGINDAPALARADVGVAIGAGTDVAIEAADVVLVKSSLLDAAAAVRLGRATLVNIYENLFWAFVYNVIGIPLAAGAFGLALDPMFGAAAMSVSSFCVVLNALRLNLKKIYDPKHDRKHKQKSVIKEKKEMENTYTMQIEGMMCPHCEAAVKAALEAVAGVKSAAVSHVAGNAVLTVGEEFDPAAAAKAVTDKGYKVL